MLKFLKRFFYSIVNDIGVDKVLYIAHTNHLKELRTKTGLTQQELADKLGCARSAVASWESGKRTPNKATADKLADFFNVSINELFEPYKEDISIAKLNKRPDLVYSVSSRFGQEIKDMIVANNLTYEEIEDVKRYIEFLVSKRKSNK